MTWSDAEIAGRKSPLWANGLAMAALLLAASGAKADIIETFDVSGSFQIPMRTFMGTVAFDFSNNSWTAKSADVTVDGLPAYDQNPYLWFTISGSEAALYVYNSSGNQLTLMFKTPKPGTLVDFNGGVGAIVGGEAFFGTGILLNATGGMTRDGPADPVPAASVPEASTWAMMLLGFAGLGIGAAARHARRGGAIAMRRRQIRASLASMAD